MDKEQKKEIAVIGSEEFTLGFRLAGIKKSYVPENFDDKIAECLEKEELGIIITEERLITESSRKTQNLIETSVDPIVIGLSEEAESERLQQKIKRAIGADITG